MSKKKILIVEDEAILSLNIKEHLKLLGHEVVGIAVNYEDAVSSALKHSPDLILMDILLNGEPDGISAVQEIHRTAYIPVLYLTACDDMGTAGRANKTRHSGYLKKPVNNEDLEVAVTAVLNKEDA